MSNNTIELLKETILEDKNIISEMNVEVLKLLKEKKEMADFLMDINDEGDICHELTKYGLYDNMIKLINKHRESVLS